MRLILGFFFFGVIFYAIWFYYPEAFQTLVDWAAQIFNFIRDSILELTNKSPKKPTPS